MSVPVQRLSDSEFSGAVISEQDAAEVIPEKWSVTSVREVNRNIYVLQLQIGDHTHVQRALESVSCLSRSLHNTLSSELLPPLAPTPLLTKLTCTDLLVVLRRYFDRLSAWVDRTGAAGAVLVQFLSMPELDFNALQPFALRDVNRTKQKLLLKTLTATARFTNRSTEVHHATNSRVPLPLPASEDGKDWDERAANINTVDAVECVFESIDARFTVLDEAVVTLERALATVAKEVNPAAILTGSAVSSYRAIGDFILDLSSIIDDPSVAEAGAAYFVAAGRPAPYYAPVQVVVDEIHSMIATAAAALCAERLKLLQGRPLQLESLVRLVPGLTEEIINNVEWGLNFVRDANFDRFTDLKGIFDPWLESEAKPVVENEVVEEVVEEVVDAPNEMQEATEATN